MNNQLLMLLCSVAPALLLVLYVIYRDRKQPEPLGKILKGVFFGMLSIIVTLLIHCIWFPLPEIFGFGWVDDLPYIRGVFNAFYRAAIPEETAKLLMLWLLLRKNKAFDENLDGIVYAVCVGMGFAGVENIQYVFSNEESWQMTAVVRCIFAVPGHYIDAVIMGYYYSLVHFHPGRYGRYRILVWLVPVIAHGVYDSICMVSSEHELLGLVFIIAMIWFSIKMHKSCLKKIHDLELMDRDRS